MTVIIDGTKGTSTPGLYSNSTFTDTYVDGVVVDYTTGTGRITVGGSDGFAIRNGGPSSPVNLLSQANSGYTTALQGATSGVGTGISFPATQVASSDANTLDDYEEGTFTPTYTTSGTQPTISSYTNQVGRYVKIGRQVTIQIYMSTNMSSVGTGNISISGLPFTVDAAVGGSCAIGFNAYWITPPACAYAGGSGTVISLYQTNTNVALPASAFNASSGTNYTSMTLTYNV